MTAQDYKLQHQDMVDKLAKDETDILVSLSSSKAHLLHMGIGLMDEFHELEIAKANGDEENILEELGDLLFYTEGLVMRQDFNVRHYKFKFLSSNEAFRLLARTIKRHCFYETPLDFAAISNVYSSLLHLIILEASLISKTIVDVQKHNMAKLSERYPNYVYTDKKAVERADKTNGDDAPFKS